jgi:hypothetical protein
MLSMRDKAAVYNLGELDVSERRPHKVPSSVADRSSQRRRKMTEHPTADAGHMWIQGAWSVSFAMFVPGAGHILRGDLRRGVVSRN